MNHDGHKQRKCYKGNARKRHIERTGRKQDENKGGSSGSSVKPEEARNALQQAALCVLQASEGLRHFLSRADAADGALNGTFWPVQSLLSHFRAAALSHQNRKSHKGKCNDVEIASRNKLDRTSARLLFLSRCCGAAEPCQPYCRGGQSTRLPRMESFFL